MAIPTRLELLCRLFIGLFVGFFCVTTALFVRYKSMHPLPQVAAVQSSGASPALPRGTAIMSFSAATQSSRSAPPLKSAQMTLIASSSSTVVTFIAALVVNLMSWRSRQRGQPGKDGARPPDAHHGDARKRVRDGRNG
ncbi:hypothetical protein PWR63_32825 [Paraburkholderia sp. A2WS-5]|uniref:hypothetical protein n=1 Tax=unclassified Paraburkholderia TaxID=2615204 RepID=UPI003B7A9366